MLGEIGGVRGIEWSAIGLHEVGPAPGENLVLDRQSLLGSEGGRAVADQCRAYEQTGGELLHVLNSLCRRDTTVCCDFVVHFEVLDDLVEIAVSDEPDSSHPRDDRLEPLGVRQTDFDAIAIRTRQPEEELRFLHLGQKVGGIVLAGFTVLIMIYTITKVVLPPGKEAPPGLGNTESIARLLFTDYLLPFEVTSVLLLVAIVGAVVLAKTKLK